MTSMEDPTNRYTAPDPAAAPAPPPPGPAPATTPPPTLPPLPPAQPAWRPPPADHGRNASLIFGVIILVIGLWFFASTTLGLDLPDIEWSQLWPLILIGIGAWIVYGATRRNG
jgi:hypothetical protein